MVPRLLAYLLVLTIACGREPRQETSGTAEARSAAPNTPDAGAEAANRDDDGMWPMPARTHDATRFSYQTEITRANVSNLRPVWSFSTGVLRGHEAAPLVVGSTMYVAGGTSGVSPTRPAQR